MATSQPGLAAGTDDSFDEENGLEELQIYSSDSESDVDMPNNRAVSVTHRVSLTVMSFGFKFGPPDNIHKIYNLRRYSN